MTRPDLTVLILTYNEEIHLERCISSAASVAGRIVVIDSFSSDRTVAIAQAMGAEVHQHAFVNHAAQLAWALDTVAIASDWVMRMDADEVIDPELAERIRTLPAGTQTATRGYLVPLYVCFRGHPIRHGGYPQWQLRIWRNGHGRIEQRWMDEKIVVEGGPVEKLAGAYYDDNLNGITWWTAKHNNYATREAIDLLNIEYGFRTREAGEGGYRDSRHKRWLKEHVYRRLPIGARALAYFIYRYFFRLGLLDGAAGFVFHVLQGFWYRFLVDVKVWEVEHRMREDGVDCVEAIRRELGIELNRADAPAPAPSD